MGRSHTLVTTAWSRLPEWWSITAEPQHSAVGWQEQWQVCKCLPAPLAGAHTEVASEEQLEFAQQIKKTVYKEFSRGDAVAGAWLCLGRWMWAGWDGDLQFWQELAVIQTQRGMETLRVLWVCLNFLTVLPPHWPSSLTKTILKTFQSILLWVLPKESGWTFLCAAGGRCNHWLGHPEVCTAVNGRS